MKTIGIALALVWTLGTAKPVEAARILVSPGPGTPLQDAIASAPPGATLLLRAGTYLGSVTIDRPLKVRPATSDEVPYIDAGCGNPITLDVAADQVRLAGLRVIGGTTAQIRIANRQKVRIEDVRATDTCNVGGVGLQVTQSTRLRLFTSFFGGDSVGCVFEGIPLASRIDTRSIDCRGSATNSASIGALLENVSDGALLGKGGLVFRRTTHQNPVFRGESRSLVLHSTDGVLAIGGTYSTASAGPEPPGFTELELDATSDNNKFICGVGPISGAGTGNCYTCGSIPPPSGFIPCP